MAFNIIPTKIMPPTNNNVLAENIKANKKKAIAKNQDPVNETKYNKLFPMPLSIFLEFPVNLTFIERVHPMCVASEAATLQQFTFTKNKITGGMIFLLNCYMLADLKVTYSDADFAANNRFNYVAKPLNMWAESIQLASQVVSIWKPVMH